MILPRSILFPLVLLASSVLGADIYVAQKPTGNASGSDSSDCLPLSALNAWSNVNAGDTVHLVGTLTNTLNVGGSGSMGNPVTVKFESGANFTAPFWNPAAIVVGSHSNIVIDGGVNGLIVATANGSGLAYTNNARGVMMDAGASWITVQNLTVSNMYVRTPGTMEGSPGNAGGQTQGILVNGSHIFALNNRIYGAEAGISISSVGQATDNSDVNLVGNIIHRNCMSINMVCNNGPGNFSGLNIVSNRFDHWSEWENPNADTSGIHLNGIYIFENSGSTAIVSNVVVSHNWFGPDYWLATTNGLQNSTTAGLFVSMYPDGYATNHKAFNLKFFNNVFVISTNSGWNNGCLTLGPGFYGDSVAANNSCISTFGSGAGIFFNGSGAIKLFNNFIQVATGVFLQGEGANGFGPGQSTNISAAFMSDYNCFSGIPLSSGCMNIPTGSMVSSKHPAGNSNGRASFADWLNSKSGDSYQVFGVTIAQFFNVPAYDTHSTTNIPLFNAVTYAPLTNDTVLVYTGTNYAGTNLTSWGITNDFYGNPRPATGPWTIGAVQTTGAPYVPPVPTNGTVTVTGGTGSGTYLFGATVTISTNAAGFVGWTGDVGYLSSTNVTSQSLTMPSNNVTLTANYATNTTSPKMRPPSLLKAGFTTIVSGPYPKSGLVAYWTLSDGSGTTPADSSGNGHNGSFTGTPAPTWGSGYLQYHTNGYVAIPYSSAFDVGTGDFTIAFAYKSSGFSLRECPISKDTGSGTGWLFYFWPDHVTTFVSSGVGHDFSTGAASDGSWHHYALTRSGGACRLYIDGVDSLDYTEAGSINQSGATPVRLGIEDGADYPAVGQQKNVFFFNRALTSAEVSSLP